MLIIYNWTVNRKFNPEMSRNEIDKYRNGWQHAIKKTIM